MHENPDLLNLIKSEYQKIMFEEITVCIGRSISTTEIQGVIYLNIENV